MQKLRVEILEKMMEKQCTNKEVDFLIYVAKFQNNAGTARGIYYKDVCEAIDISYQGFYDCKKSLENKGIISAKKLNYYDWDITILNNKFKHGFSQKDIGRGYVDVSVNMIKTDKFQKLRANAKIMALYLLREWKINKQRSKSPSYQILKSNFFQKFRSMGVSTRMMRSYLSELEDFVSVYLENGKKYFLTFKEYMTKNTSDVSQNEDFRMHEYMTACRRNKILEDEQQKKEILNIMSQHQKYIAKNPDFVFSDLVRKCLGIINGDRSRAKWVRKLSPALIQKIFMEEIETAGIMA